MIRMEMKRAFHNRNFYIALIIGCGIAIGQYIQNVLPMIKYLPMDVEKGVYPHSVFNKWMGGEYHTLWPMLFYFILPVLAALPHGDSYYQDIQSGYFKNICTRTKKSSYLKAKAWAAFASAFAAITIPLFLNLLLASMTLPAVPPEVSTGFFYVMDKNMGAELFLEHPWIYILLYILLDGIFAAFYAGIALAGTCFVSGRFVVTILSFTIHMILYVLAMGIPSIAPVSFLSPSQPVPANAMLIAAEGIAASAAIFIFYYKKGKTDEYLEE